MVGAIRFHWKYLMCIYCHNLCGSLEFAKYITNFDLEDFLEAFRERDVDEEVDRTVSGEEQVAAPYE